MSTSSRYTDLQAAFRLSLPQVRAVSFDVFDTLFVRAVHEPEALFDLIELKSGLKDFKQLRMEAQSKAFQMMHREGRKEISLSDIYRCYSGHAGSQSLATLEQELENLVLLPNPEIVELLNEASAHGKVIALTSDMYLPESFFQTLLARFDIQVNYLLISSACNSTKRDDGALFDHLIARLGMDARNILHVGDNPLGDVKRATERGLRTLHYLAPTFPKADVQSISDSVSLGLARYATYHPMANAWWQLGWQFGGPVLTAFRDWVHRQAEIDGIDLILFVSRDGYLMHQLHQTSPLQGPPAAYLRGSRVSFTMASLTEQNFALNLPFLMSGADNLTLQDLLLRIGVDLPSEKVMNDLGLSSGSIVNKDSHLAIERFLSALHPSILKVARECRRGLYQHLLQLGLTDGMRVAFVDVGWNGTTQKAFQAACEDLIQLDLDGYYLGLAESSEQLQRTKGIKVRSFSECTGLTRLQADSLYRNRAVAELFFSAPHPTTIGYRHAKGHDLEFVEDRERGVDYDIGGIIDNINRGIQDYARELERITDSSRPGTSHLHLENMLRLLEQPTPEQTELIGQIYNWDAWASSDSYRTYFATRTPPRSANTKPDLWPGGWKTLNEPGLSQ